MEIHVIRLIKLRMPMGLEFKEQKCLIKLHLLFNKEKLNEKKKIRNKNWNQLKRNLRLKMKTLVKKWNLRMILVKKMLSILIRLFNKIILKSQNMSNKIIKNMKKKNHKKKTIWKILFLNSYKIMIKIRFLNFKII